MSELVEKVKSHFSRYSLSTILVKSIGAFVTLLVCLGLFVAPFVNLQSFCFFRAKCTLFTFPGWFEGLIFLPLWIASWIHPKVGTLTLLGWCTCCLFSAFISAFGGWKTSFSTVANLLLLGIGIGMVAVDAIEDKKGTEGYQREEYEDDL